MLRVLHKSPSTQALDVMSSQVFERLSFKERGHFSNAITINPVLRLQFCNEYLKINRRFGSVTFPFNSLHADILKRPIAKGYGGYSSTYMNQTLVTIKAANFKCTFDLSGNFPDFKPAKQVLHLIKQNISFTEKKSLGDP